MIGEARHQHVTRSSGRGRALVLLCGTCLTRWPCDVERKRVRETEVKR